MAAPGDGRSDAWMVRDPAPHAFVVDGDAGTRDTLGDIVRQSGCRLTACATGRDALAAASSDPPDVAIVDVRLPDMGGIELVRALHWQKPELHVVVVASQPTLQSAVEALNIGAARYIRKPFGREEVLSTIRELVMRQAVDREHRRSTERLKFMRQLGEVVLGSLEPEPIIRGCLARIADRLGARHAAVLLVDERKPSGRLRVAVARGRPVADVPADETAPVLAAFAADGATLRWVDRSEAPRLAGAGCDGVLLVRLVAQRMLLGLVVLGFPADRHPAAHDVDLVEAATMQVGLAVGNARLYQETQRAYRELRDAQRHLVRTEKYSAIGRLAAGLAHEIGTPLAIISGRAEVLLARVRGDATATTGLETIIRQIDRISVLIRKVLGFAREYPPASERLVLGNVLGEALALVGLSIEKAGATVRTEGFGELPPITGDSHQLQQVFINLLMNSVDAIQARDAAPGAAGAAAGADADADADTVARPAIRVTAGVPEAGWIEVEVSDDGVGIAPAHLERIFDPFFTTKDVGTGTGLGLAVVDGIVGKHGGELTAESREGEGTTIRVRLPVGGATDAGPPRRAREGRTRPG